MDSSPPISPFIAYIHSSWGSGEDETDEPDETSALEDLDQGVDDTQPVSPFIAYIVSRWGTTTKQQRRNKLQSIRRHNQHELNSIRESNSVDVSQADKLVSKLLVLKPELVPESSRVRDANVDE